MTFYAKLTTFGQTLQPYLLASMRLYWGLAFFSAGLEKFHNHEQVVQFFQSLHIPFATANAYFVAFVETLGGLSLALGFFSRVMALPLIAVMGTACLTAHQEALLSVFQNPEGFISQAPFNYLLTCLLVLCFGPGKFSFDYLLMRKGA